MNAVYQRLYMWKPKLSVGDSWALPYRSELRPRGRAAASGKDIVATGGTATGKTLEIPCRPGRY